jgi:hypothetical protein
LAVVGSAHVIIRAITKDLNRDLQKGFNNTGNVAQRAGQNFSQRFMRGFNQNLNTNIYSRLSNALRQAVPGADAARMAFQRLVKAGYALGTALPMIIGGISGVIGGLAALAGSAGGAIASVVSLTGAVFALGAAMATIRLATGGIGRAVSLLNRGGGGGGGGGGGSTGGGGGVDNSLAQARAQEAADERVADARKNLARIMESNAENIVDANDAIRDSQQRLNEAYAEGVEYIQQLGFDAEDAALAEKEAALELEKARLALAGVQDLPPNSRARQEAELAYQQAELDYRRAKDRSADLNAEQDRLARTGVAGTEAVISATEDLADAEQSKARAVRDALQSQADAEEDLRDAIRDRGRVAEQFADAGGGAGGGGGGGGGGIDPFEGLNDAQIAFAKFIASLKPKFDELSRIAAESFLPKLTTAITTLMGAPYDAVARGVGLVGSALGDASIELANTIAEAENISDLNEAFDVSADIIRQFGGVASNVWDIFMSLIASSDDQLRRFVGFIESKTGAFAEFLDAKQATGELQEFFETSGDMMARFGDIFGNIFGGFGAIIRANFGPGTGGYMLIDWLDSATEKFAALDDSPAKAGALKEYFIDVAANTRDVAQSIGELGKEIIALGANRNIGEAFRILEGGAGFLGNILQKGADAAPVFAELVVEITRFVDLLTDTGAIEIFFQILTDSLRLVNDIMENETVAGILLVTGQIAAALLAFNTLFRVAGFGFRALTGSVLALFGGLSKVANIAGAGGGIASVGTAAQKSATQVGGLRGGIGNVVSALGGPLTIAVSAAATGILILDGYVQSLKASTEEWSAALSEAEVDVQSLFEMAEQDTLVKSFHDASDSADSFRESLDLIANNDFARGFSLSASQLKSDLKEIGENLAVVAQTDLPAASNAFRAMTTEMGLNKQQTQDLLNAMPAYKDELIAQAGQLGLNMGALDSVTQAEALLKIANDEAITQSGDRIFSLGTTTGAVNEQKAAYDTLAGAIRSFGDTQRAADEANRVHEETTDEVSASVQAQRDAYFEANGTMDGFKASMDETTEQGRLNKDMLDQLAESTLTSAAANYENTGSVTAATVEISKGREALIKQMQQLGYTREEAEKYADELGLIPSNVSTHLKLTGYAAVYQDLMSVQAALRSITGDNSIHIATGAGGQGGLTREENGGIVEAFANGGITAAANGLTRLSQVRSGHKAGGGILWGEPNTGWEAYISGKNGQEERNRAVLNDAANRLGMVPNSPNVNIKIDVHPSPGMDETELASLVARELAFQMRKGGVGF